MTRYLPGAGSFTLDDVKLVISCCGKASVPADKVSGGGSVAARLAPGWSDSKVSFTPDVHGGGQMRWNFSHPTCGK